ncbi:MAG: DUF1003 domain-containing protein [Patescibacteria group bacterium]
MDENSINSYSELVKQLGPLTNTNTVHKDKLTKTEKLALFVTKKIGTMGFFAIIFFWTMGWLGWNVVMPEELRFDPYPAFVLWLFISNLIQIHLMPLIMIGQNIQGRHAELRAEHEYEASIKSEKGIEALLEHMEKQQDLILTLLKKIEILEKRKN